MPSLHPLSKYSGAVFDGHKNGGFDWCDAEKKRLK
jgi:hypothetical protein